MLGRSVSAGTTSAMKVSATVKSSAQPGGICVPRAIPTAVLASQALHCASPAPRKYHWIYDEREVEAVSCVQRVMATAYTSSVSSYASSHFHRWLRCLRYRAVEAL